MNNERLQKLLAYYLPAECGVASLVGGQFIRGNGEIIRVRKAHDGSELYSYRDADEALIPQLADATKNAGTAWWALTAQARGRIMYQIGAEVRKEAANIAEIDRFFTVSINIPHQEK